MAAVKGPFRQDVGGYHYDEAWSETPKWHWRYWFGYRMRRVVMTDWARIPTKIEYRTYYQHAMATLEERYGPKEDPTYLGEAPRNGVTPTHDPRIVGQVWNDNGTLRISQG